MIRRPVRVLIVGRSPSVLHAAVALMRDNGRHADATNQFDTVLDDYDVGGLDLVVFGGMVPTDARERLRREIARRNADVHFVRGLVGIPGVIAAQVEGAVEGVLAEPELTYDVGARTIRLTLDEPSSVSIHALWVSSWRPPEPTSASLPLHDAELARGTHRFAVPDEVPREAAYATVAVGRRVGVLTLGPLPPALARMAPGSVANRRLPDVAPVATHHGVLPGV
jgi:hypothetical protein